MVVDVFIEPALLRDHKGIFIKLDLMNTYTQKYGTRYWKLKGPSLKNADLELEINNIIEKYWNQVCDIGTYKYFWELMKHEIQCVAIKKGKFLANLKRDRENTIIKAILDLQMKNCDDLTSQEVLHMDLLQSQLDNIYEEKTKGAFIRSRCKWLEQGEKNTKYFLH